MHKTVHLRDAIDRLYEKKVKEDLPTLKRASMHRYEQSKNTLKRTNNVKAKIDNTQRSRCRLSGDRHETIQKKRICAQRV